MFRKNSKKNQPTDGFKKGFPRVILKILGVSGIVFLLLLIALYLFVRLRFPPNTLKQMAVTEVKKATGRDLTIATVDLNILSGFELKGLILAPLPDSAAIDTSWIPLPLGKVTAEKIRLKYYLRHLLKKRFIVREIALESPTLVLEIPPPDSTRQETSPQDSLRPVNLPVQIELNRVKITEAIIFLHKRDSVSELSARLDHLNFELDNLFLPKGNLLRAGADIRTDARLRCEDSRLSFANLMIPQSSQVELHLDLDLNIGLAIRKLDSLNLMADLKATDFTLATQNPDSHFTFQLTEPLGLGLKTQANYPDQILSLEELHLNVGAETWLNLNGSATKILQRPEFNAIVAGGEIPIRQVLSMLKSALPGLSAYLPVIQQARPVLSFAGTRVVGKIGANPNDIDLSYQAKISLSPISLSIVDELAVIEDLSLSFWMNGRYDPLADIHNSLGLNIQYSGGKYQLNDTTEWSTEGGTLGLDMQLGNDFLPRDINFAILVHLLRQAKLSGDLSLHSKQSLAGITGQGNFRLTDFPIQALPATPARGFLSTEIELNLATLDDIRASISMDTKKLQLLQAGNYESIPNLDLLAIISAHTDTLFKIIYLDSVIAEMGKVLNLRASAFMNNAQQLFGFNLEGLFIHHAEIFSLLPASVLAATQGIKVSGISRAQAAGSGTFSDNTLDYDATFILKTQATNVDSLAQKMQIHGINGSLDVRADPSGVQGNFVLQVDSVMVPLVRSQPIRQSQITFKVESVDFSTIRIDAGAVKVPDLGIQAELSAEVKNLARVPSIHAKMVMEQNASEPIGLTRDISIQGNIQAHADVQVDSTITLKVNMKPSQVSVYLPQQTTVSQINGTVEYSLFYDQVTSRFINRNPQTTRLPGFNSVSYLSFNPYFHKNDQPLSELRIGQIDVAGGYQMKNLMFLIFSENARLEIPNFTIELYGGNMGGYCFFELPENADIKNARYQIASHISSINSELLLKNAAEAQKEGVINGNFAFSGTGVDPEADMDITGYFYITEIGPKVATNLLRMLDPEDKDSGIKTTRRLLGHGFKPRLFSFELKHGFFYPTILFSRPFYFPIRLSDDKFELSRKPLKFFIKQALETSKKAS